MCRCASTSGLTIKLMDGGLETIECKNGAASRDSSQLAPSASCPLLVGDLILVIDHMPGTHRGIIGYVYEVTFVAKDKHSDCIGVFPAEGMPYRCGSTNYTTWKGEWYRKLTREQAILETARILADRKAVGSEISIPFDLFSDLADYAFDLCGEWAWKKNERAGNAKEYAALHATAAHAIELRNKHTSFPNNGHEPRP